MVIERYHPESFDSIYERLAQKGRMLPDGLYYIDSWVSKENNMCFQLMETENDQLFDLWVEQWKDLMEFEIIRIDSKY